MALKCEFINVIINLSSLDKSYAGGREQFIKENQERLGKIEWYDDYIYRTGAMSPRAAQDIVVYLVFNGLKSKKDNKWQEDICVIDTMGGLTLECSWVKYDPTNEVVSHIDDTKKILYSRANPCLIKNN